MCLEVLRQVRRQLEEQRWEYANVWHYYLLDAEERCGIFDILLRKGATDAATKMSR